MGANSRSSHSGDLAGKAISNGILLLKHTRLGVILMVFALTAGLTLYVYTKPVFYAKALIKFNILNLPTAQSSRKFLQRRWCMNTKTTNFNYASNTASRQSQLTPGNSTNYEPNFARA